MTSVTTPDGAVLNVEHLPRPGASTLLLLNSLGTDLALWDRQVEALRHDHAIVRFDARGHGGSSAGGAAEVSMDDLARDALAVLQACGVERAHVCGLSIGGMVAMRLATAWPQRVDRLVLCNTAPYMQPPDGWAARIEAARRHGLAPMAEPTMGRWFTPAFRAAQPREVERIRRMFEATDPRGYAACAAAIRDMDQRETLRAITAPTLVIGGTHDAGTPPAHAQAIADAIPGARLALLEAAHLSNVECADAFTAAVRGFLAA